jgi:hypothetical protein
LAVSGCVVPGAGAFSGGLFFREVMRDVGSKRRASTLGNAMCDTDRMTPRKEGLILMVLGVTALALSAPWWLLGPLGSAGLGPRLGLLMGLTFVFIGFFWMFKAERQGRPNRRRRGVPLRVVPNSAAAARDGDARKRLD